MKFKDLATGYIVESDNEFVIEQYKNHPDKYKEIKAKETKPVEKTDKE